MAETYPSNNPNQSNDPSNPQNQQQGSSQNPPERGGPSGENKIGENNLALERRYGLSMSQEDRQKSFQVEDERWSRENQIKDWLKLGLMMLIMVAWSFIVFFLEPGLR